MQLSHRRLSMTVTFDGAGKPEHLGAKVTGPAHQVEGLLSSPILPFDPLEHFAELVVELMSPHQLVMYL